MFVFKMLIWIVQQRALVSDALWRAQPSLGYNDGHPATVLDAIRTEKYIIEFDAITLLIICSFVLRLVFFFHR